MLNQNVNPIMEGVSEGMQAASQSLTAASQQAAAASSEAVAASAEAAQQAGGGANGAVILLIILVAAMAAVLVFLITRVVRAGQASIIDPAHMADAMIPGVNKKTRISGGQYTLEQLDDDGYTIFSQTLCTSRLSGTNHIVVVPPAGVSKRLLDGNIVQTIRLKKTKHTPTVSHASPICFYLKTDDKTVAMAANPDNFNPVTFDNGSEIKNIELNNLLNKVFYIGDEPLIITKKGTTHKVKYQGAKKPDSGDENETYGTAQSGYIQRD